MSLDHICAWVFVQLTGFPGFLWCFVWEKNQNYLDGSRYCKPSIRVLHHAEEHQSQPCYCWHSYRETPLAHGL